jgi:hypothetical protein
MHTTLDLAVAQRQMEGAQEIRTGCGLGTRAKDANLKAAGAPNFYGKLGDIPGIRVELRSGRHKWVLGVKNNFPSADPKTVVENWKSRNKDGI